MNAGWDADTAYPAWICVIKPSRTHRFLLLLLGAMGSIGVLLSPISILVQVPCWAFVAVVTAIQWRNLQQTRVLHHHGGPDDTINQWTLSTDNNHTLVDVYLENDGYRSAGLLMLVFKPYNGGQTSRVPVWFDAVPATKFSYLNAQLMFNTGFRR